MKYDEESFFDYFYRIEKVEDLKKFIQLFIEKNPESNFYEDVFLSNVLYNINKEINEINKYILNLPEIEPYLNKENTSKKHYGHKPPLLYLGCFEVFMLSDKIDINIRQSETNDNLLCITSDVERLKKLLSIDNFEYTIDDIIKSMKSMLYPYTKEVFEFFLDGILYDDKESMIKIKLDFTNEQLSSIFNMICIRDDRYDLTCHFYRKFADRIDVNYIDPTNNRSNLLDAIDCNSTKMVRFLLDIPTIDINLRANTGSCNTHDYLNSHNITPFCYAVECNVDEIINLFFKRKNEIDINATYSKNILLFFFFYQITCLHCAAKYGTVMLVKKILEIPNIDKFKLDKIFSTFFNNDFNFFFLMKITFGLCQIS
ncbi:hypothetical protein M9Y10_018669 [Tritrichomonas musculus]|uniref:DUF3447 domain-containing protein n=1 Tax=Tritrichomonas musculus TaxID=1915356 RepID=A0ABR2HND3_9EUKA